MLYLEKGKDQVCGGGGLVMLVLQEVFQGLFRVKDAKEQRTQRNLAFFALCGL